MVESEIVALDAAAFVASADKVVGEVEDTGTPVLPVGSVVIDTFPLVRGVVSMYECVMSTYGGVTEVKGSWETNV
mgnify:CR=1 FL=1